MNNDNIFAPEKMSDMSDWQAARNMKRYNAKQDQRNYLPPMWQLAARSNKERVKITRRVKGKVESVTTFTRAKSEYSHG